MKLAIGLGLLAWLLWLLYWPIGVAASAVATSLAFRLSIRRGVLLLLLGPLPLVPMTSFLWGVGSYIGGIAVLRSYGLPHAEFWNLDPRWRCYRSSSGCVTDGSEPFTQGPNNVAVRMMIGSFGPMTGAYTGAYPTRLEAFSAIRAAGPEVKLSEADRQALKWRLSQLGADPLVRVADYKSETRIIGTSKVVALMAVATDEVYAAYFFDSLGQEENVEAAIQELNLGLSMDPEHADFYLRRAYCLQTKGEKEKAAADYREYLKRAPKDAYTRIVAEEALRLLAK